MEKKTMSNVMIGAMIGAVIGMLYSWTSSNEAAKKYPVLRLPAPKNAEQDFLFQAWCDANQFKRQGNGRYIKGRGWLTSSTELWFEQDEMCIQETVNFLCTKIKFALNAPMFLGRPVRMAKIKQLNKLIKHWGLPPVVMGQIEPVLTNKKKFRRVTKQ
ncbi:hypothetical protein [Kingella negevensis]|uniref:hypothetical protein n=2 Tax=Kingella negevensis TaxID=1522312 RepID=UPI00117B7761|nr:hypothetical protein [Kingella negevensis]MDK4688220.1 hypothetical protein [Kingella negevensis]WII91841.1 hypothetical protein QEO93_04470 [Kingella negevensis]